MFREEKASVVLITLVFTTVLMVLVATLATAMLSEMRIAASSEDRAKAFYLAEAGLEYGRYILNDAQWGEEEIDDEGNKYQKPVSNDWYDEIASGDNQIELRRYEDSLMSIGHYGRGNSILEIEYELGLLLFKDDLLEEMPEENHIENKYISEDDIDANFGGGGSIRATTIESTDDKVGIKFAGGGSSSEVENTIFRSKTKIDLDLASGGSIECAFLEAEEDIKIHPSNNTKMKNVVIKSKNGEVTIDLGSNSSMENVHIYSDKEPNVSNRGNISFVKDENYYWHEYQEYESYSNHLDCNPGYQGREAYIEREGSWQEI